MVSNDDFYCPDLAFLDYCCPKCKQVGKFIDFGLDEKDNSEDAFRYYFKCKCGEKYTAKLEGNYGG